MMCVFCNGETKVIDKRIGDDVARRRRECIKCGKRFTTYERADISIAVLKKDGRREAYSREKLTAGMLRACEKRPISRSQVEDIADSIENELRNKGNDVTSRKIGDLVMKNLKRLDKVAYIRFASVYHSFDDISSFEKEVKLLKVRR